MTKKQRKNIQALIETTKLTAGEIAKMVGVTWFEVCKVCRIYKKSVH